MSGDSEEGYIKEDQSVGRIKEKVNKNDSLKNVGTGIYSLQSSCYKLFKREIIERNHIRFNNRIYYGEDGLFVFQYLQYCDGIAYFPKPLWNILDRPGSATVSGYNRKWLTMISAVEIMLKYDGLADEILASLEKYKAERTLIAFKGYLNSDKWNSKEYSFLKKKTMNCKRSFYKWTDFCKVKMQLNAFLFLPEWLSRKMLKLVHTLKRK